MDLRSQILEAADLPLEPVDVPAWGCTVYVRPMSGDEAVRYYQALGGGAVDPAVARNLLLAICLCDEHGERIFADADAPHIGRRNAEILGKLHDVAVRCNRLGVAQETPDPLSDGPSGGASSTD